MVTIASVITRFGVYKVPQTYLGRSKDMLKISFGKRESHPEEFLKCLINVNKCGGTS